MDLSFCTLEQRESIEHISGPLLISAGAGSGKTFTLTQRIAYALSSDSGPALSSIDEVLAITFTEKAAAEIKARVKQTLRSEGLGEEALKVDGAWISTIHGMCSRILKTHALELRIDPQFSIISDAEQEDLIKRSINEVLRRESEGIEESSFAALFHEYSEKSFGKQNTTAVAAMVSTLLSKASGLRGGLNAVSFGPEPETVSQLARRLVLAYERLLDIIEEAGTSAAAETVKQEIPRSLEVVKRLLEEGRLQDTSSEAYQGFAQVLSDCHFVGNNCGSPLYKSEVKAFQHEFTMIINETSLGMARPFLVQLVALAQRVQEVYEQEKQKRCKLDNDDLLSRTLDAFEDFPEIAQRYVNRFRLVMVDEFQDTSQLQIDMIAHLAGDCFQNLCTVGDAQQSIYRFRGADVNVYKQHKDVMRSQEVDALYLELSCNFRSHSDVLSFVDRVFEQPEVFGSQFMSLKPNKSRCSLFAEEHPRIDLALLTRGASEESGKTDDARAAAARYIARRFADLKQAGYREGDMVILLGKMTHSLNYAQALREVGLDCVIAGGSTFSQAPEVKVVVRLLEALVNPQDSSALFSVLASDIVCLSADDFLELGTEKNSQTGMLHRRDIDKGFEKLIQTENSSVASERLNLAAKLFRNAQQKLGNKPISTVAKELLIQSGYFLRLEKEETLGVAMAANILKALRIVESLEAEEICGPASIARRFQKEIATTSEAPGALSGSLGNAVRIMTIHSSKGLEFPFVALADFADNPKPSGKLLAEAAGNTLHVSLIPSTSMALLGANAKKLKFPSGKEGVGILDTHEAKELFSSKGKSSFLSNVDYRIALAARGYSEELQESRRKLYVGLTRASEALIVTLHASESKSGELSFSTLTGDVLSAVFPCGEVPREDGVINYQGEKEGRFCYVGVEKGLAEQMEKEAFDRAVTPFIVPLIPEEQTRYAIPFQPQSAVFSYSKISVAKESLVKEDSLQEKDTAEEDVATACLEAQESASMCGLKEYELATNLGSAFHRAAQYAVETGRPPTQAHIECLAVTYGLTSSQIDRLFGATRNLFESEFWAEVNAWECRRAEVPFYRAIGQETIEGEIDLLCTKSAEQEKQDGYREALVVDYKTGGSIDEAEADLQERHRLQAECYAYVLLEEGYDKVQLHFVRVEQVQPDSDGEPQVVSYEYSSDDRAELCRRILEIRALQKKMV